MSFFAKRLQSDNTFKSQTLPQFSTVLEPSSIVATYFSRPLEVSRSRRSRHVSLVRAPLLAIVLLALASPGFADDAFKNSQSRKIYLGGSAGLVELSTKFSVEERKIRDSSVASGSLMAGVDISPRIDLELSVTATEKASVTKNGAQVGDLAYRDVAVSALGYWYRKNPSAGTVERDGLSAFIRLGAGYKDFDTSLASRDSDRAHLLVGLGSEYGWKNGVATRTEVSLLDDDAKQLSFSLLKRFNRQNAPQRVSTGSLETGESRLWQNRLFVSLPTIYFSDNDPRSPISEYEQHRLDKLAQQLLANPGLEIEVRGHSDASDTLRDRLIISRRRAITVSRYLQSRGVRGNRMHVRSFASSKPLAGGIAEDAIGSDQFTNRRVDFEIYEG